MGDQRKYLYSIKAMYLGSEPMGELLDGQNGSDAIQIPLKKTIQRTDALGDQVELSMTPESLIIDFVNDSSQKSIILPIDLLAYCGALRQVPSDKVRDRDFETLDKSPNTGDSDPPLFVTIFRHDDYETTLFCHSFVIRKDDEAMEMVKLVMEIYYNLVRLQDMDETTMDQTTQLTTPTTPNNTNVINQINDSSVSSNTTSTSSTSSSSSLSDTRKQEDTFVNSFLAQNQSINSANLSRQQEILNTKFDSLNVNDNSSNNIININKQNDLVSKLDGSGELVLKKIENNNYEIVSANELIKKTIDSYENDMNKKTNDSENNKTTNNELDLIDNYSNLPINNDQSPIIIKKPNNEQIVYKQNVFIRWLQPPTPPPPAPIIIREIQEPAQEQLPPLIIYKQAPRPETPPPLVIRERPPSPLNHPREPLIIERRVQAPAPTQRKIIIENLPAPPPKPRDIILEKWLPSKETTTQRPVYYQKAYKPNGMTQSQLFTSSSSQKPVYELIDQRHEHSPSHFDFIESQATTSGSSGKKIYKQIINKKTPDFQQSSEMIYAPAQIYSSPSQSIHQVVCHQPSEIYYTPNSNRKSKVAGYRIIRQIIPGPNSTPADIEKALARSQRISTTTVYPNQRKIYSPSFDLNTSSYQQYPIYSSGAVGVSQQQQQQQNYEYFYSPSSRLNTSGSSSNNNKHLMNSSMIHNTSSMHHSTYAPHNIYTKTDIYRSTSIDNF